MNDISHTVETCLLILSGDTVNLAKKDENLITSLAGQIDKNIGLTDRQLRLARKKIDEYQDQLVLWHVDTEQAKQNTLLAIRYLDRSRWIRLEESEDGVSILIRFVYQRNLIRRMEDLARLIPREQRTYDPETMTSIMKSCDCIKNCVI